MSILDGMSIEDALKELRDGFDWGSEEIALQELIKRVIKAAWDYSGEGCNAEHNRRGDAYYVEEIYKSLNTGEK